MYEKGKIYQMNRIFNCFFSIIAVMVYIIEWVFLIGCILTGLIIVNIFDFLIKTIKYMRTKIIVRSEKPMIFN